MKVTTKEERLESIVEVLKGANNKQTAEVMYNLVAKSIAIRHKFNISLVCNMILLFLYYA